MGSTTVPGLQPLIGEFKTGALPPSQAPSLVAKPFPSPSLGDSPAQKLTISDRLAGPQALGVYLSAPPDAGVTGTVRLLHESWGLELRSLCLYCKPYRALNHLPCP